MKRNNKPCVAIATIKFKTPKEYRPRTLTFKKCFVCVKRDDAAVEKHAQNIAEECKRKLAEVNHGIECTYSIKIDTISVDGIDFIRPDGNI